MNTIKKSTDNYEVKQEADQDSARRLFIHRLRNGWVFSPQNLNISKLEE